MEEQEEYNEFVRNTDLNIQDMLNGKYPQKAEIEIINKINPNNLLDIGCGSGHRMFPFYEECNINYQGIEKFSEIIQQSRFRDRILSMDIGDINFIEEFNNNNNKIENIDLIVLFGVINGFIDLDLRIRAWKNISSLVTENNKLVVNTLINANGTIINENWYSASESGVIFSLPKAPPQYFYSEKELTKIFNDNGLSIKEYLDEDHHFIKIRYYILSK